MRKGTIIAAVLVGGLAFTGCTPSEEPSNQPPSPGTPPADAPKHPSQQSETGAGSGSAEEPESAGEQSSAEQPSGE